MLSIIQILNFPSIKLNTKDDKLVAYTLYPVCENTTIAAGGTISCVLCGTTTIATIPS